MSSLFAAVALGGGCSLLWPATPPPDEGTGEGEGEGEGGLAVVAVDGDGSARPIVGERPAGVFGVDGAHRVAGRLRVTFAGADVITTARISEGDLELDAVVETTEEGVAFVTVPDATPMGRVVLLTLWAGAASAQAQVFFLQGEPGLPGPPGQPGPPGANALVDEAVADVDACPLGGRRLRFFTDVDGDGAFTDGEPAVTRDECDAVVTGNPVLVIDDEAALVDALARLSEVRIAAGAVVTLQLAPGTIAMSAARLIDHVDGERIVLAGDPSGTTTLEFPDNQGGLTVTGGLRLRQLTIASPSPDGQTNLEGIGLFSAGGGFIVIDSVGSVVVTGFGVGVQADQGGVLTVSLTVDANGRPVRTLQAVGNNFGFNAGGGGVLEIPGALARDSTSASFMATGGSIIAHRSSSENAALNGYVAQFGGFIEASDSQSTVLRSGSAAYVSGNSGALICNRATGSIVPASTGNAAALFAANGGSVFCASATMNGAVIAVNGGTAITNDTVGTGLTILSVNNATVIHLCLDDAAIAAGCRVPCTNGDAASVCIDR